MNLKRLQTFVHAAKHKSFSEVADIMNMTQSGVSRQIKTLEDELDIQLFERSTTYVELTSAGRMVYKKTERLLQEWELLVEECKQLKHELSGSIRIGASTIPAVSLLPRIIKSMQAKYPRIEFVVDTGDSSNILNKLQNQQIDAAVVGRKPEHAQLAAECIAEDRLVLIGAGNFPRLTSLEDMKKYPFIIREQGSGTREAVEHSLRSCGMGLDDLHLAAVVSSTEASLAMAAAGIGVSFVSYWALQQNRPTDLKILHELPTNRCFYISFDVHRASNLLIQAFVQEAAKLYSTM